MLDIYLGWSLCCCLGKVHCIERYLTPTWPLIVENGIWEHERLCLESFSSESKSLRCAIRCLWPGAIFTLILRGPLLFVAIYNLKRITARFWGSRWGEARYCVGRRGGFLQQTLRISPGQRNAQSTTNKQPTPRFLASHFHPAMQVSTAGGSMTVNSFSI